jgi:hypothetical protein
MLDQAFLDWLRATTEARWADPSLRDSGTLGLGEPVWQPGTRWRGGISPSDLEIVEAMFSIRLPAAYRRFLATLHTPDPALAAVQSRAGRLVRVEERRFTDWTGATTPVIAAFERPLEGLLRGVSLGRWHASWGPRPADERERARALRRLAAAAPRLIPFAGQRYLVAARDADDGPILAVHGADAMVVAPDLRGGLLRELGLADPDRPDEGPASATALPAIPFWSDVVEGIPWLRADPQART